MLRVFKNKEELSSEFCNELQWISVNKRKIFIALSGGNTPKIIYDKLAKNYKDSIDWSRVHLFWSDERCVPPDDAESNYGMTKKYLLDHIEIPEENVHRIKGENEPEAEAKRYSDEIVNKVTIANGLPKFDLVMLGLGEDGHTASIFLDQMHLLKSKNICDVAIHPSSKQKRITITGKVINNSGRVIFLVTGKNKADIIKKVIDEKKQIYPAEFINPVSGELLYFLDAEASLQLNSDESGQMKNY